jgi:hydroxymethylglutaryl-CoA lyase
VSDVADRGSRERRTIPLRDVTLRDGLQDERPIPTADKVRIHDALVDAGVRDLEITSFVRADRVPALADAEQLVSAVGERPGATHWALVLNERGAQRALAAGVCNLQFVLSVTEEHNLGNAGCTVDQSIEALGSIQQLAAGAARLEVTLATAFGCPHTGPVPIERVLEVARRALACSVDGITVADTIGTASPTEVRDVLGKVIDEADGLPVGAHLHDTRGLALANALAAVDAGAARLDASLGGLGGCPFAPGASGNLPIEDLVHALDAEAIDTGIDLSRLLDAAQLACEAVGRQVASHVGAAGPRFATLVARDRSR